MLKKPLMQRLFQTSLDNYYTKEVATIELRLKGKPNNQNSHEKTELINLPGEAPRPEKGNPRF
jgi:hypothetical protein